MNLDEAEDAVTVWVARVDTEDETIVTAWAWRDKAEQWVAHERGIDADDVTWRESGGSKPGITVAGHYKGDIVASMTQVEVMDPIALAKRYPRDLPPVRDIIADNE